MKCASQAALSESVFPFVSEVSFAGMNCPCLVRDGTLKLHKKNHIYHEHVFKTMALKILNGKLGV